MELEEAKQKNKKFCEYEDSLVLTDNILYEYQEAIETVLKELENSVPKKKIEDKIEELIKEANYRTESSSTGRIHFKEEPCDYQIQVLQELLEDK